MKCPKCGKEIINDQVKCECGFEMVPKKEKNRAKMFLLLGIFAVIAVVIVVSLFVPMDKSAHDYIIAESEDAYYLVDAAIPKKEPVLIAKITGENDISECYVSSDNTKLLYGNNGEHDVKDNNTYYDLYIYDIAQGTSTLVDSKVFSYSVNASFDTITYFKGTRGELWQKKLDQEPEKLLEKIYIAKVSEDLKELFYVDRKDGLYIISDGKEPELISKKAEVIAFGDKNVLYNENGKLMKYENGKKTVINDSFYMSHEMTSDSGYFYANARTIDFSKSFTDDMLQSDKNINSSNIEAYSQRLERDEMRLDMASKDIAKPYMLYSLYYYDGTKAVLVSDNVLDTIYGDDDYMISNRSDHEIIGYRFLDSYKISKVTMSEFYKKYGASKDIYNTMYDELLEQSLLSFAKSGKVLGNLNLPNTNRYMYNKETQTAYIYTVACLNEEEFEYKEDFYTIKFNDNGITQPELYAENVNDYITDFMGNELVYCKYDEEQSVMDIYYGKKLIAEKANSAEWIDDSVLYITKFDENDNPADMLFENSELMSIKGVEDCDSKYITLSGSILCYNYESEYAAVVTKGVVTPLSDKIEYIDFYIPWGYSNESEILSPLYYDEVMSEIW